MVAIAPAHVAMAVAVDSVAVLKTIRPVILLDPGTTRQVEQSNHYTHADQRHPVRIFHWILPFKHGRSLASGMPPQPSLTTELLSCVPPRMRRTRNPQFDGPGNVS